MINKVAAYEKQQIYNSRFKTARDSGNAWDAANAEVYRLASQSWGEIAASIGTGFDAELHVRQISERWRKYVATGITWDSLDAAISANLATFVAEDRRLRGVDQSKTKPSPKAKTPAGLAKDDPRHHADPKMIDGIMDEMRQLLNIPVFMEPQVV